MHYFIITIALLYYHCFHFSSPWLGDGLWALEPIIPIGEQFKWWNETQMSTQINDNAHIIKKLTRKDHYIRKDIWSVIQGIIDEFLASILEPPRFQLPFQLFTPGGPWTICFGADDSDMVFSSEYQVLEALPHISEPCWLIILKYCWEKIRLSTSLIWCICWNKAEIKLK